MKDDKELMIERFHQVKSLGFVQSHRSNNTGIGKTFEDYVGVVENNIDAPDLFGFEIKSHRGAVQSYITLFTKSPDFPSSANAYLKDNYGFPYEDNPLLNKLHVSMFANKPTLSYDQYIFRLINDKDKREIRIGIYDPRTSVLVDDRAGYRYSTIEGILVKKMKNLFYVSAERRYQDGKEVFHFNHAEIYTNPSFEKFLELVDRGMIMYDIRIGSYGSGKNYGKAHDHGSGFRIQEGNIHLLYGTFEEVE